MTKSPIWTALDAALQGSVAAPDDANYLAALRPVPARFANRRPSAVAAARSVADVVATVRLTRDRDLRMSVRSGGHGFDGRSSAGDVVLDVRPMRGVVVDGDRVTVGAGVRLGELHAALAAHGRALPAGTEPSVGVTGITLGGGLGLLGRRYGLTSDHLISACVVLADGRAVTCDDRRSADLFWALRGAGGVRVGVVTSLTFRTVASPNVVTCFRMQWPAARAAAAVDAWLATAPHAADRLDVELRLTVASDGTPRATLLGAMLGDGTALLDDLAPLLQAVGARPTADVRRTVRWDALEHGMAVLQTRQAPDSWRWLEYSRSEYFRQPWPTPTSEALLTHLTIGGSPRGQWRQVALTPWGGAYNHLPEQATAFAHRNELFLVEHLVRVDPRRPSTDRAGARTWLSRSFELVHHWGSGRVYPNFPDLELDDPDAAYHGANAARLRNVQRRYDPDGWFTFPLPAPPARRLPRRPARTRVTTPSRAAVPWPDHERKRQ